MGVIYRFDISEGSAKASWVVDLKNAPGSIKQGEGAADCTIIMKDKDFVDLMSGAAKASSRVPVHGS